VVSRFTVQATHDRREFLSVAPTGRQTTYNAIFIHRIEGGKIAEERSLGTVAQTLMEQRPEQERVERERIEQELEVARDIQQASLPKEVPTLEGLCAAWHYRSSFSSTMAIKCDQDSYSAAKRW
jgi:serine phosphatase RsbU (regulator of sigma subunit)